eukprot:GGOE01049872.1.p1 GENE.GGOE01049872.1~~GGOE01049872.1.p1  ORF type:complete len:322 (-),score=69.18 GGOE01049872.1:109-993(-)
MSTLAALATVSIALLSTALAFSFRWGHGDQHIYLIRHGDKMSKYPVCGGATDMGDDRLCYNASQFGNNAELSPCGHRQSESLADWLANRAIQAVVSSPYLRALYTALPLAERLDRPIKVEPLVSEDRQAGDAFRQHNRHAGSDILRRVQHRWDMTFSSPPILTPEGDEEYWDRIERAGAVLAFRFPPSVGNVAVFSHATPVLSLGYVLCGALFPSLEAYVQWLQPGIAAAGVMHLVRDSKTGRCKSLDPVDNSVFETLGCGLTRHSLKHYSTRPGMYHRTATAAPVREPSPVEE